MQRDLQNMFSDYTSLIPNFGDTKATLDRAKRIAAADWFNSGSSEPNRNVRANDLNFGNQQANGQAGASEFDWSSYLTGGGLREDAISKLNPEFAQAVSTMIANAPEDIRANLQVTSAYRSPEVQAQLYQEAIAKYGSPEAARKHVAPPGNSFHNFGSAIDFKYANDVARSWVHNNAGSFGLYFPMGHEPWHIELAGSRNK